MGGRGWAGWSGVGGKWDNCNSIINKYIKKTNKQKKRSRWERRKVTVAIEGQPEEPLQWKC